MINRRLLLAAAIALMPPFARAAGTADDARAAMAAGDFAEAYCIWRALADAGDAEALYSIGWMYHNGYGLTIDDLEAIDWWTRAAQRDHTEALLALGNLHRLGGRGVSRDRNRAADYFIAAAVAGEPDAAVLLRALIAENHRSIHERVPALLRLDWLGGERRVSSDKANLREGPGTGHTILATLSGGTTVVELTRDGRWVRIGAPASGRIGWLHDSLLSAPAAP